LKIFQHLLSDTDYIWKDICLKTFKTAVKPNDSDETWREFYFTKKDEQTVKFELTRQRISAAQKEKPKERVTQMATVKFVPGNVKSIPSSTIRTTTTTISSSSNNVNKMKIYQQQAAPIRSLSSIQSSNTKNGYSGGGAGGGMKTQS
jgi:hypothetical protein